MSRRASRRHSFILVYQIEFYAQPDICQIFKLYDAEFITGEDNAGKTTVDSGFVRAQAYGICENLEFIDGVINRYITGWSFARIAKIDLAILRLAIYELAFMPDIPTRVCINEAVELAKIYGGDDAHSFVNGLLASAQKELRPGHNPIQGVQS